MIFQEKNVKIYNNIIKADNEVTGDIPIVLSQISGVIEIIKNSTLSDTTNHTMQLGAISNTATKIVIQENKFMGESGETSNSTDRTATIAIRASQTQYLENVPIYIIGNELYNSNTGNIFNFSNANNANLKAFIICKYNYFDEDCVYKLTYPGTTFVYDKNYYSKAPTNSSTTEEFYNDYTSNQNYTNQQRLVDYCNEFKISPLDLSAENIKIYYGL